MVHLVPFEVQEVLFEVPYLILFEEVHLKLLVLALVRVPSRLVICHQKRVGAMGAC